MQIHISNSNICDSDTDRFLLLGDTYGEKTGGNTHVFHAMWIVAKIRSQSAFAGRQELLARTVSSRCLSPVAACAVAFHRPAELLIHKF